jgi:cytochrome c oxidase subunit II
MSVLEPAGPQAGEIENLWWFYFSISAFVWLAVIVFLILAVWRARRQQAENPPPADHRPGSVSERPLLISVSTAIGLTVILLFVLLLRDFFTGQRLQPSNASNALTIRLTGLQWWWRAEYQNPLPQNVFETANEIHVPVGRPIQLLLQSNDVIHSFWMPQFQGKKDMVPGHPTSLWFQVDRPGTYYGQCAEFCGYQHAHMRLTVVAESPEKFAQWQDAQRASAQEPTTDSQRHGRDVFLQTTCVMCHTIQGTPARSRVGPPLTHFAGNQRLGAGAFENTREHLRQWIRDPQSMKPGVRMPQHTLATDDLNALLDYLQSLH